MVFSLYMYVSTLWCSLSCSFRLFFSQCKTPIYSHSAHSKVRNLYICQICFNVYNFLNIIGAYVLYLSRVIRRVVIDCNCIYSHLTVIYLLYFAFDERISDFILLVVRVCVCGCACVRVYSCIFCNCGFEYVIPVSNPM